MAGPGMFHWNELISGDVEKAKAFYGGTLGWTFEDVPGAEGSYTLIRLGDAYVGGILRKPPMMANVPDHWFAYIAVDDIEARVKAMQAEGGRLMRAIFDVPNFGRIAIIEDATGVGIGLVQPG